MTNTERSLASIAHHEAGHVVMAARQGLRFDSVTIEPHGATSGHASVYPLTNSANNEQAWRGDILVHLAGPVAEQRFSGVLGFGQFWADMLAVGVGVDSDYGRAWKLSALLNGISLDPESGQLSDADVDTIFRELGQTEEQVRSIFAGHDGGGWKAVDALAVALLSHKTLSQVDALSIISPILFPNRDRRPDTLPSKNAAHEQ